MKHIKATLLGFGALVVACGGGASSTPSSGGESGAGNDASAEAAGGGGSGGTDGQGGTSGAIDAAADGATDAEAATPGLKCIDNTWAPYYCSTPRVAFLDVLFLVDTSQYLREKSDAGCSAWDEILAAVRTVTVGVSHYYTSCGLKFQAAVQFFPDPTDPCNPDRYVKPAVDFFSVPESPQLQPAFDGQPLSDTGTFAVPAALTGTMRYARDWADRFPDHRVIVVLDTDREFFDCYGRQDGNAIYGALSEGLQRTPPIWTYAIALTDRVFRSKYGSNRTLGGEYQYPFYGFQHPGRMMCDQSVEAASECPGPGSYPVWSDCCDRFLDDAITC